MTATNHEAEQAVVGSCILDPTQLDVIADRLSPADFSDTALGQAFALLVDMRAAGVGIDATSIVGRLRSAGLLDRIGGVAGIARMTLATCDPRHARDYASEIRSEAGRKRFRSMAAQLVAKASDPTANVSELSGWIDSQIQRFGANRDDEPITLADAIRDRVAEIEENKRSGSQPGILSGLEPLDAGLGGFHGGDLVILAARPSIGKSALGVQCGIGAAEAGHPTLFVSLEMRAADLANRQLAARLGVESRCIRAGLLDDDDTAAAMRFVDEVRDLPFHIWSTRSATASQIRSRARVAKATTGLSLLIVDYIGLVAATDPRKPRWESITEVSGSLKSLALELNIPVIALCQLNREAEKGKPTLANLRDAGAIEQDADVVMLLDRESRDATLATLDIAKARNGATGAVDLSFDPAATTFGGKSYEWTQ